MSEDEKYTSAEVSRFLNDAANDIDDWAGVLPDEGVRDALNLIVNVVVERMEQGPLTISEVIERCYDEATPDDVRGWIR